MKKLALALAIYFLVLPVLCRAQDSDDVLHYDVRFSLATLPENATDLLMNGRNHTWWDGYGSVTGLSLSEIYHDYNGASESTNAIGADVFFHVHNRFDIGIGLYCNHLWYNTYNGVTDQKTGIHKAAAVYVSPVFRLNYVKKGGVHLYGQVSLGMCKYINFDTLKYTYRDSYGDVQRVDNSLRLTGEIIPLGIEVGRKWFGFAEVGAGNRFSGVCMGFGHRF